jgi:hypothetical protein
MHRAGDALAGSAIELLQVDEYSCASAIACRTSGDILEFPYRDSVSKAPITGRTPSSRV